ncbi:FAD-dependent monooxygenase [Azospira restricta]|uniref:FAD-dependent monooxygenase n=1 Tax=Azospira restricta TaxID=404405 RepID=A0A974SP44_9RHOO|nr:FAD-dependent monooxygenase [Azospira restricta]QRJ63853.1 FAD-dependent monooxygenase [Azospira restricta]
MTDAAPDCEVLIVGAGPVGMTLALSLAAGGRKALLLDRRARGAWRDDPRALALAHGTRQLLAILGAWNAAAGTAIHDIHVSQRGGFGRTQITREELAVEALGYVMRYRDLAAALDARLPAAALLDGAELTALQVGNDAAVATIRRDGGETTIRARLVVHAEGTPAEDAGVAVSDYRQHAVLAEVRPQPAHGHRAWERFTPDGPLALLPLGDDYSVVFTVPPTKADALLAMDDDAFLAALQQQFGPRVRFAATSPRARYPLALRLRRQLVAARQVWIGNAAQTLHPVSGQGFNLGIRDACELAQAVLAAGDAGDAAMLAGYARGRRLDRRGSVAFTDGIVRAFSNDFAPLRLARGLGLLALDLCPPARRFVADRMIWGARAWP